MILIQSLEAPARALWQNAGFDPSAARSEVSQAGPGHGLDVLRGEVVPMADGRWPMADAGIVDSTAVVQAAVHGAITSAALALTIGVLVHRANPIDSAANP